MFTYFIDLLRLDKNAAKCTFSMLFAFFDTTWLFMHYPIRFYMFLFSSDLFVYCSTHGTHTTDQTVSFTISLLYYVPLTPFVNAEVFPEHIRDIKFTTSKGKD